MTTVWMGPINNCDICGVAFTGKSPMYDANVGGRWGNICRACFVNHGCSLGTGRGQQYELQKVGDKTAWVKTAG